MLLGNPGIEIIISNMTHKIEYSNKNLYLSQAFGIAAGDGRSYSSITGSRKQSPVADSGKESLIWFSHISTVRKQFHVKIALFYDFW